MSVIAHYKLNDNAASATVIDATGVYNGTYKDAGGNENTSNGSTANSRGVGTCLDFDHANSEYVEIADNAIFTPALTPLSISAWVYMHDADNFSIASKYAPGNKEWLFYVRATGPRYLTFSKFDESVGGRRGQQYAFDLSTYENQWIHVAVTDDGGVLSSGIKLFLSGTQVNDSVFEAGTFVAVENLGHVVWIGRQDGSYANGLMDNVIIFNTELNEDEVKALYHGGHGTEIAEVIDLDRRIKRRQ